MPTPSPAQRDSVIFLIFIVDGVCGFRFLGFKDKSSQQIFAPFVTSKSSLSTFMVLNANFLYDLLL